IAGRVDDSTGRLFTKLDEAARAIHIGIEENSNVMVERLNASTGAAAAAISSSSAQLVKLVETSRATMTDGLERIIKNYVDQAARARTDLSAHVDPVPIEIAGRVDDSTGRLYSRLDDAARTIQVGIEENSNSMVERLTATTELASNTIGTSGSKLE